MNVFPAIDLYDGKVVRLFKGDYKKMTVYNNNPIDVVKDFVKCGAKYVHVVDLEGAKFGNMPNANIIHKIKKESEIFVETGGGIRSEEAIIKHINAGIDRVILGTSAVENIDFLKDMIQKYHNKIAVSVDIKDGYVATRGWLEKSKFSAFYFLEILQNIGVDCVICTDISKDGAMSGINFSIYKELSEKFSMKIIASGGVSSIDNVVELSKINMYGAIIGKAYYTGDINLSEAIEVA